MKIQDAIANAYISVIEKNFTMPRIHMQRFPIPSTSYYRFANQLYVPILFLLSLNYTFVNMIRFIAIEKERQLKETMKIMGLSNWMHYLSWFIRSMSMLLIPMLAISMCLKVLYTSLYISFLWKKGQSQSLSLSRFRFLQKLQFFPILTFSACLSCLLVTVFVRSRWVS